MKYDLVCGSLDQNVDEVIYDSRKARPDSVFVCIRGSTRDSHEFIPDVLRAGCKVLVVEKEVEVSADVTVIRVESGRLALAELSAARFGYPAEKLITIGITGTKGKTTTSYMIKAVLEAAGKKTGLIGTNGAVIGDVKFPTSNTTPESYVVQDYFHKMVEAGCECCVMEVSSQALMLHSQKIILGAIAQNTFLRFFVHMGTIVAGNLFWACFLDHIAKYIIIYHSEPCGKNLGSIQKI